jgi:hypothetical protein
VAADIPSTEPSQLRAGDTWKWTQSLSDYPASAWTLKYRFKSGAAGFEITATASGDDYAVSVAAATTAGYVPGHYTWVSWVEGGTAEKYTVATSTFELLPDLRSTAAGVAYDARTHARKMLDAIEAWMEGRDPGVAEYEINGRRMKYWAMADLIKFRQHYKVEVAAEQKAEQLARGLGVSAGRIQFRL